MYIDKHKCHWCTSGNRYICFEIWCHNKSFKPWKVEQYSEFRFYLHLKASGFVLIIALSKAGQICVSTVSLLTPFWFTEWKLLFPSAISLSPENAKGPWPPPPGSIQAGPCSSPLRALPLLCSILVTPLPTWPARYAVWFPNYQGLHRLFQRGK